MRPVRESAVLGQIIAHLVTRGDLFGWRQNVGTVEVDDGRWVKFGVKGCADWIGLQAPSGRFVAIETKRPKGGVWSQEQKDFAAQVAAAGGVYVLARSVEEVDAALGPVTKRLAPMFGRVIPR